MGGIQCEGVDLQAQERFEMLRKFWSENLKERDRAEDLGVDGRVIL
jgi:hypothetical protein